MSRVLLVDDNLEMLGGLTTILSVEGHEIQSAPCGLVALEMIQRMSSPVDCVVLDHVMPGMTGIEFLAKLREQQGWKHTPVIIITGVGSHAVDSIGLEKYPPTAVILKPFHPPELLQKIKEMVVAH